MRFSQFFTLNHSQAELDFVDIDTGEDLPLFFDPYVFVSDEADPLCRECATAVRSFFDEVLRSVRSGDRDNALRLLENLQEPNEFCFGLSSGAPSGRGIGSGQSRQLWIELSQSRAARSGMLQDLAECELFVEGIGPDKISDIVANIVRSILIKYTNDQCKLHGIALSNVAVGPLWNTANLQWERGYRLLPVVNGTPVILTPKKIVRWKGELSHDKRQYYDRFIIDYLRDDHLRNDTNLVRLLRNGDRKVYKKDVKAENPLTKDFLFRFSRDNPSVFSRFRHSAGVRAKNLSDINPDDFDQEQFIDHLILELRAIPGGNRDATRYHRMMIGVLEFIFYPHLAYPEKEIEIHDGRKRIDILYANAAHQGFFARMLRANALNAIHVPVECKNYTHDPANPELDQLAGRFSPGRGKLGILLARSFVDRSRFIDRCADTFRDDRGAIIPLADDDIVALLTEIRAGRRSRIDARLEAIFREVSVR